MLDMAMLADRLIEIARPFAPRLPTSSDEARSAELRDAGVTSLAAVQLMLGIEAAFDLAIPDHALTPDNFASVDSIARLIARLKQV